MKLNDTILTEEYRGGLLDLTHYGYVCVVDEKGAVIGAAGDPEAMVYYRSASKPLQAIPVIMRGLHTKYGLTEEESVIFSGSHIADFSHIAVLESIFEKTGLREEDLIMRPTAPVAVKANEERIKKGLPLRKLYHNCSGKHAALMLLQRELTGSAADYWKTDSAAQQEVLRVLAALSAFPAEKTIVGIDGCGVPVFAVPMRCIATAYKNLAYPEAIRDDAIRGAVTAYVPLIHKYPVMMRGTGYICTLINMDPNIVAKGGANGVYGLGLKKERLGISFKLRDGTESAWPILLQEIFRQLGYKDAGTAQRLKDLNSGIVLNDNNTQVGTHKPVFDLGIS